MLRTVVDDPSHGSGRWALLSCWVDCLGKRPLLMGGVRISAAVEGWSGFSLARRRVTIWRFESWG